VTLKILYLINILRQIYSKKLTIILNVYIFARGKTLKYDVFKRTSLKNIRAVFCTRF
jgi:hypothetical protein